MRKILLFIMDSFPYQIFLRYILPKLRWPKGLPWQVKFALIDRVKKGDILLASTKRSLGAKLIPGDWDHAAIYTDRCPEFEIAEMVAHGFNECSLKHFSDDCDSICVLRPMRSWTPYYIKLFVDKCLSFSGAEYDRKFSLGVKTLYCSEIVYHSDYQHRLDFNLKDIHALGTKYLSPDGIYKCTNLKVIYCYKG
jgi:hypothetical protein